MDLPPPRGVARLDPHDAPRHPDRAPCRFEDDRHRCPGRQALGQLHAGASLAQVAGPARMDDGAAGRGGAAAHGDGYLEARSAVNHGAER
jgi:hypothetical protein